MTRKLFILLSVWIGLAGSELAAGQIQSTPLTLQQMVQLKNVLSVQLSPNGQHIAYVLMVPRDLNDQVDGPAWRELHVVDIEGKSRPYISGEVDVRNVDWIPDGRGISFLTKRTGDAHRALYVIPIDGGEARKILQHETDIREYSWHPNGDQVAFLAQKKQPAPIKQQIEKGFNAEVYEEQLRDTCVWIANVGNPISPPVPQEDARLLELSGSASELHWSPSGEQLALALAPTSLIDDHYMKRTLHVVAAENGKIVARFENPGKLGAVAWSPDGAHLAIISAADIHDPSPGRLIVASVESQRLTDIMPDYEGDITSVHWQDADTLTYMFDEGVWSGIGTVNLNDRRKHVLLPAESYVLREMSNQRLSKNIALISDSPVHPREVYLVASHENPSPKRLTFHNEWLEKTKLAPQEAIQYTSRDGTTIDALLIRPLEEQRGRKYPLVVVVHGGPEAHFGNGWLTRYANPGQVLASRGFAVLYPNYRGSTGRGVTFSKLGQSDYGGAEFNDLIDGINYLVETGLVDPDRVGITGGSYGGYAAAWCATYHTKLFAASVMFVGISDQISKFGTTDVPNEMYLVHARKWPWEDWDFYRQRSPISYVEQCRTPILILHGKEDPRVHPSQSLQLYRYLKSYGQVPVRLVLYPGEGHGNRKIKSRYDLALRLVRWMEHYLTGEGGEPPPERPEYDLSETSKDETPTRKTQ